jgi:hypothetical protein
MLQLSNGLDEAAGDARYECAACGAVVVVTHGPCKPGADAPSPCRADDPANPTAHPCGSPGKVLVLSLRAAAGLPLFHPLDSAEKWPPKSESNCATRPRDLPLGVSWDAHKRKYRARATLGGARVYLGLFDSAAEAESAVETAKEAEDETTGAGPVVGR